MRITSLLRDGKSNREVAKTMNVTRSTVASLRFRSGLNTPLDPHRKDAVQMLSSAGLTNREISSQTGIIESTVSTLLRLPEDNELGATVSIRTIQHERESYRKRYEKEARILLLFDTHIPHVYAPAFRDAMEAEGSFDLAILGGDELNQERYSRFRPDDAASVVDEIKMSCDVEDAIRDKVPELWKLRGNHDERMRKMILDRLADVIPRMHVDAQGQLMKAIDQVERWHHDRGKQGIIYHPDFWMTTGNADRPNVIAHPDRSSTGPYATIKKFRTYLREQSINPGSLCMGHLHRYLPWAPSEGSWISEMPAMCQRVGYMANAKALGGALHVGYGVLVQDKHGMFVPNKSYVHFTAAL